MNDRVEVDTVKELAILVTANLENVAAHQKELGEKIDKIYDCLYGNGTEGVRTQIARHDEFIKQAMEADIIAQTKANSEFRANTKAFVAKLLLAAIGTGGAGAAIWQAISKAIGG